MKYFILIIVLAILAGCGITEPILDQEDAQYSTLEKGKVIICHKNSEGNYIKIEVADPAYDAHLAHGDGIVGGAVPDKEGFRFTKDCDCIPSDCPITVEYGGQTYTTVFIGSQCWFKESLNVGIRIDGSVEQTNNSTIEKYCYDDLDANCTTYGGLYQWDEAMQYVTTEGTQGICPTGWHIPKIVEFAILDDEVAGDGNALKEVGQGTGGDEGTNASGFSALFAGGHGQQVYPQGYFAHLGDAGYHWSSTEYSATIAYWLVVQDDLSYISLGGNYKRSGYSVRCLKD